MTDNLLLIRAQRGEREALDELCRREWRPVYALAWNALGNAADAQDLTQEAFLRALKSLGSYRATDVPFHAWLAAIARNLIRDGWRKRQPRLAPLDAAAALPSFEPGPEARALVSEEERLLRAALAALPSDYQTVLRLRILDGLSARDVGHVMGRRPDAVRQLQRRALTAMRVALAQAERSKDLHHDHA